MPNTHPNPDIDLQQISTRNTHARHIVAGCAAALPTLADMWRALDDALSRPGHARRAGHAAFGRPRARAA